MIFKLFPLDTAEQKYITVVVMRVWDNGEEGGGQIPRGNRDASDSLLWVVLKGAMTTTSWHYVVIMGTVCGGKDEDRESK